MPRPTIHCPQCRRELFNLHHPWCLWCGASIAPEQFELVAQRQTLEDCEPQVLPLLPPTYGTPLFGLGMFRRLNPLAVRGCVSPWERKLRIVGAALGVGFVSAKLAEALWSLWHIHQMVPLVHHLR